jgi:hypothetical protein
MILVTSSTLIILSSSENELDRRIKIAPFFATPVGAIERFHAISKTKLVETETETETERETQSDKIE